MTSYSRRNEWVSDFHQQGTHSSKAKQHFTIDSPEWRARFKVVFTIVDSVRNKHYHRSRSY
jgi:hypothetical protein